MRKWGAMPCLMLLATLPAAAGANEVKIADVPSLTTLGKMQPLTVAFADRHDIEVADPTTGLIPFTDWAEALPEQKRFLSPFPAYTPGTHESEVDGVKKSAPEKLDMYVA